MAYDMVLVREVKLYLVSLFCFCQNGHDVL